MLNYRRPGMDSGAVISKLSASLANPFDQTECIPDGAAGVGCFSTKELYVLNTQAGGSSTAIALCPRLYAQTFLYNNSITATPTIAGNWSAALSQGSISSQYNKFRTVSCGMRASFIGSTTSDAGVILVGQVSGQTPLSTFNGVAMATAAQYFMNYKTIPIRNGTVVTWRPVELDHMSEWDVVNTGAKAVADTQAVPYLLMITYVSSSSVGLLHVECVCNYEGQYFNQTFMPGGINSVPEVPPVPGWFERVQQVASMVESVTPLVGAAVEGVRSGGMVGAVRALANGISYPTTLSRPGLPRALT